MRPAGDGTYELLILVCSPLYSRSSWSSDLILLWQATSRCSPRVINDNVDGIDAYATNDLLEPHPTREGFWKVYGRVDDQIMLSNGEKAG